MNHRKFAVNKIENLEQENERLADLSKGQLDLLDQTKASRKAYEDLLSL
ncbi:hypothetical protein PJ261_02300 [Streptococcus dysgalactiae]